MDVPERKANENFEAYVERLIREAQEDGEFDRLPRGKPLPLTGGPPPEGWWAKEKLRRENLSDLPASIAIRHEAERTLAEAMRETDERLVREKLDALNRKIRKLNATHVAGPPTTLAPLDVEAIVARWRERRRGSAPPEPSRGERP
ncbi:MAG TPA: DnaJ family domain-containing protein [Anaeromyxobacter sp.]